MFHAPEKVSEVRVVGRRLVLGVVLAGDARRRVRPSRRRRFDPVLGARGLSLDPRTNLPKPIFRQFRF